MPEFIQKIKSKAEDLWYDLKSLVPDEIEDYLPYVLPALAALFAVIAIFTSVKAGSSASKLQNQAAQYKAGQARLASAIPKEEEVDNTQEAIDVIGKMDLMLQYKDLSTMPNVSSFADMERMAQVSSSAEEAAGFDYDNGYYEAIKEFAGDFGGVLIKRSEQGTEPDIKMAAYQKESDMTAPVDNTVMNVLVQNIRRTIPSGEYGVADTSDTLLVLSGTDIRKFSSIERGSVMYALLGTSTGSKLSRKFICTGLEPGSIDNLEDVIASSASPAEEAPKEEEEPSTLAPSNGPNDVSSVGSDGTVIYEDGTKVKSDGTVTYSDGTIVESDGTVIYPDGMIVNPDGTISGGSFTSRDSEDAEDTSDQDNKTEQKTTEDSGSALGDATSMDRVVYTANGTRLDSIKEHNLVLYMINSQTGTVTITYWDTAGSEAANAASNVSESFIADQEQ